MTDIKATILLTILFFIICAESFGSPTLGELPVLWTTRRFTVRQVPGEGSCLFHSMSACLTHETFGEHFPFNSTMKSLSEKLRYLAIANLKKNHTLRIDDSNEIDSQELLSIAAESMNLTVEAYCSSMKCHRTWGGGPEIVSISNALQRNVNVYQLQPQFLNNRFGLKLCTAIGCKSYRAKKALNVLYTSGKYPYITHRDKIDNPDHFLALVPALPSRRSWWSQLSSLWTKDSDTVTSKNQYRSIDDIIEEIETKYTRE